jgi:hypothetical protein
MRKVVEVTAMFDRGELRKIMRAHGLKNWDVYRLVGATGFPYFLAQGILTGSQGLNHTDALTLSTALRIPFEELFGDVFK